MRRREATDGSYTDDYKVTFCKLNSLGYNSSGEKVRGFDSAVLLKEFSGEVLNQSKSASRKGDHWRAFDVRVKDIVNDQNSRLDLKYWDPDVLMSLSRLERCNAYTIKELNSIETRRGKSPPSDVYVDEKDGYALVVKAGSNISQHGLLQNADADYIEKSVYDDMPDFCKLRFGDVLLSSTGDGTLGKSCVYALEAPAIADGHVTIIRVDGKKVDPYFLADYLRCGFGSEQIARLYTGSTGLIELTPDRVSEILIPKLGLSEQKRLSKAVRRAEEEFRKVRERANAALNDAREIFSAVV